jgi:hypothetical protein
VISCWPGKTIRLVHSCSAASNYSSISQGQNNHVGNCCADCTYQRNDIRRLGCELVRQILVVGNKMGDIDVTIVVLA